ARPPEHRGAAREPHRGVRRGPLPDRDDRADVTRPAAVPQALSNGRGPAYREGTLKAATPVAVRDSVGAGEGHGHLVVRRAAVLLLLLSTLLGFAAPGVGAAHASSAPPPVSARAAASA